MTIKLITGTMNSGKSKELIEEIEKCKVSHLILKPSLDTRDGAKVKSRAHDRTYPAVLVDESNEQMVDLIAWGLRHYKVIFIDEVQFFGESFINELIAFSYWFNVDIIASGLLKDFKGNYFPSMKRLEELADETDVLFGKCYRCKQDDGGVDVLMDKSDNLITDGDSIQIDGKTENHYETLCVSCYEVLK